MKLIRKLIKISRHLLFILTHINWIGFFKYHKKGSKNVVISNFHLVDSAQKEYVGSLATLISLLRIS
jgi:hypothetical protein